MSAKNQPDAGASGADNGKSSVPFRGPNEKKTTPEVVWSSPVSTGSGQIFPNINPNPNANTNPEFEGTAALQPEPPTNTGWGRQIFAFESDLLDSALVHWDGEHIEPTLEMIPGFKVEQRPEAQPSAQSASTVTSGITDALGVSVTEAIIRLDLSRLGDAAPEAGLKHFQPHMAGAIPGPLIVRTDGVEDPRTGWRPTGMVFFETLATPPRGIIYSSSLLDELSGTPPGYNPEPPAESSQKAVPFFDYPESVTPAPVEETEDYALEEVVVRGGRSGGGGGEWIFRTLGKMFLVGLALMGVLALLVAGSYIYYIKQRLYDTKPTGRFATVIIKPGENFRSVTDQLRQEGVLKGFMGLDDSYLMRYLAYAYENSDKIKPGVYKFDTGDNLNDVYDRLISGSKDFKITIPEGKTAIEIGKIVGDQYQSFSPQRFMELVNDPAFIKELGVEAPSLEGYLYPSTYYYGPGMKEEELVKLMVSTFQDKVKNLLDDKATTDSMSLHDHVIMASLIEREARLDGDRPLIASVIVNRMQKGMPLQIDATVNYALNNWRRLNNSDYQVQHPYNTYKIKGLPPGPITSPRIESLAATYNIPHTNYFYYVHRGDGHHAFAETYAQHQANVGRYIREKNFSGMGNEPAAQGAGNLNDEASLDAAKAPAVAATEPEPTDAKPEPETITIGTVEPADAPAEKPSAPAETPKPKTY